MKYLHLIFILIFTSKSYSQNYGCISGDCKNGFGKLAYTPNTATGAQRTYTGNFKNGYLSGKGEMVWVNTFVAAGLKPNIIVTETGIFDTVLIQGKTICYKDNDPEDTLIIADGIFNGIHISKIGNHVLVLLTFATVKGFNCLF